MAGRLEGKIAMGTGAASGIGRASALAFDRESAKVVVSDVVVEGREETVRMIKKTRGTATFIKADVSKRAEVRLWSIRPFQYCTSQFPQIAVNNENPEILLPYDRRRGSSKVCGMPARWRKGKG